MLVHVIILCSKNEEDIVECDRCGISVHEGELINQGICIDML